MALTWQAVDAITGVVYDELPKYEPQGGCATTIGRYESLTAQVPLPEPLQGWDGHARPTGKQLQRLADFRRAMRTWQAVHVAVDENDRPVWGGVVNETPDWGGEKLTVQTVTFEAVLDGCYVGDYTATGKDQCQIIADLVNLFVAQPLGLTFLRVANSPSMYVRDRTYKASDDKTVYSALTELSGVVNGPEWTIGWERNGQLITPYLLVADRLGAASVTAEPNATWQMPGPVREARFGVSYAAGKGANKVTAVAGSGATRLSATSALPALGGRLLREYRWSPSTSIGQTAATAAQIAASTAVLQSHADRALAVMGDGQTTVTLIADRLDGACPVYGQDWQLGDDVGFDLEAAAFLDGQLTEGVPAAGTARAVGVLIDDTTVAPVLQGGDVS